MTPKQQAFARNVAAGMTLSDAYRGAYSAEKMKDTSIHVEACKLMANPMVTQRVEVLQRHKERAMIASAVSDKERVLTKLRALLDAAEGTPAEQVMLRAADLLGKSAGMYRDVTETIPQRSAEEIQAELKERLQQLSGASAAH